jgi:NADPH2:quinone reductase
VNVFQSLDLELLNEAMKAIRVEEFGAPEVMKLKEVPKPQPGTGELLVQMHAVGVNPVETYIRAGQYPRKPGLPFTPGNDGAGVVAEIGDTVTEFSPGDRVYTAGSITGTYAEYARCSVSQVHRLPTPATFVQGAAIGTPYATAYRGLFQRGEAQPGEILLVHGASGGVGMAAVQLAAARGVRVFGTAGSGEGRKLVREQGALEVFDHLQPNYLEQIMQATGGRGLDLILEMAAQLNLANDLTLLAPRGRVIVIGNRGRVEIDARDAMSRDADIRGLVLTNTPGPDMEKIHAALVAGLANGTLKPVIGLEFPLGQAVEAHRAIGQGGKVGKIVLTV